MKADAGIPEGGFFDLLANLGLRDKSKSERKQLKELKGEVTNFDSLTHHSFINAIKPKKHERELRRNKRDG